MSKKQIVILVLIGIVAVYFGVRIIRNALTSEEAKIKKLIIKLAGEFEEKKFKKIFKSVSEDYTDDGKNTKSSLQRDGNVLIVVGKDIKVSISNLRVVVSGDKQLAEVALSADVSLTVSGIDVRPFSRDKNQMKLYLKKEDGEWMLYRSNLATYGERVY